MTHMEKYQVIAQALGATYLPLKWRSDEPAYEERGYFVFGDPEDWRTPRFFIHPEWRGKRYEISYQTRYKFRQDGYDREMAKYSGRVGVDTIYISVDREAVSAAKDIQRRLIKPALDIHGKNVEMTETEMLHDEDKEAWLKTLDLTLAQPRGTIWRAPDPNKSYSGPSAFLYAESNYGMRMELSNLQRHHVEAIKKFLEENL
jgi:hypothetical protein